MKRIFYLVVIIGIPVIVWFQYDRYRKFHPPREYQMEINPGIDSHYHNPEVVLNYFKYTQECETYAKYCWKEHRVDVLAPDLGNPEEQEMADTYNQIVSTAKYLEQKLLASAAMKAEGVNNEEIIQWENTAMSTVEYQISQILGGREGVIRLGEEHDGVWHLQRLLNQKGYDIAIDGVFDQETLSAVNEFQESQNLKVTQGMDRETLEVLVR